jgi:hypothetical protein
MADSPEYNSWKNMIERCCNPRCKEYARYGGRGIKVCERWISFDNFYEDMKVRPKGTSLDRINVNGDYEPSNCRWATNEVQARNRRDNVFITYKGETKNLCDWGPALGVSSKAIQSAYRRGWDMSAYFDRLICIRENPDLASNCRSVKSFTYKGETKCISAWARHFGVKTKLLKQRIEQHGDHIKLFQAIEDGRVVNGRIYINKPMPKTVTYNGETKIVSEWAKTFGIRATSINKRLKRGTDIAKYFDSLKH